jgi:hypothetical protein
MAGGPIYPSSAFPADTAGRLFPNFYAGGGGNAAPHDEGWGVKASLDADAVLELRFPMPPAIPTGTLKLRGLHIANATTGAIKYTVSDKNVAAAASPSAATLTGETQSSLTFTAVDIYNEVKTTLTSTPAGNDILVVAVKYQTSGWTLAQVLTTLWSVIWE